MTSLRCSSLPLFMKCAESIRGELKIDEWYPESPLGTAAHEAAAREVNGLPVDIEAIANLFGVDMRELGPLVVAARKAWAEIRPEASADVTTEEAFSIDLAPAQFPFEAVKLSGTADVLIRHTDLAAISVIDWKTGRRDADYREQLIGYCALALLADPGAEMAMGKLIWLRSNEMEAYSLTRENLVTWLSRLKTQLRDEAYSPGQHCDFCPRKFSCPAREEMARSALAILGDGRVSSLRDLTPMQQMALYHRAKSVASLAADVISEVRDLVRDHGPLEANGKRLELVDETRRTVDTAKAWPILQKYLNDEGLIQALTVSMSRAEYAAGRDAPRGQAGKRREAFVAELEAANAVSHTTVKKLTERRS